MSKLVGMYLLYVYDAWMIGFDDIIFSVVVLVLIGI